MLPSLTHSANVIRFSLLCKYGGAAEGNEAESHSYRAHGRSRAGGGMNYYRHYYSGLWRGRLEAEILVSYNDL